MTFVDMGQDHVEQLLRMLPKGEGCDCHVQWKFHCHAHFWVTLLNTQPPADTHLAILGAYFDSVSLKPDCCHGHHGLLFGHCRRDNTVTLKLL